MSENEKGKQKQNRKDLPPGFSCKVDQGLTPGLRAELRAAAKSVQGFEWPH